jgi:hypothetical protein
MGGVLPLAANVLATWGLTYIRSSESKSAPTWVGAAKERSACWRARARMSYTLGDESVAMIREE